MATVLLVEDDPDQLHMRKLIFEREGYQVRAAQTAAEGRALAAGCDVIVMDLRIPALEDGLRLIAALRGVTPIIVLTGAQSSQDLNVDLHLTKPCSSRVLLEAVASLANQAD
jgi:DNA-binding response OmpR family regulator